jgi:predicted nucleotidyltransferase
LDLLGELSAVGGYPELLPSSKQIEVAGILCRVASLELVIRSKEAANRAKDRQVLPELRALLELQRQRHT